MAGGHATVAGIDFQCGVAAWFAVHALADLPVRSLRIVATPEAVELETDAAVDDLVVKTKEGGFLFVNAKTNVAPNIGKTSDSALESVVDQFVRQFRMAKGGQPSRWSSLVKNRDQLILVVDSQKSARLLKCADGLFERIADFQSINASSVAKTELNAKLLGTLIKIVRQRWSALSGADPSDTDIVGVLSMIRILGFDLDGVMGTSAVGMLRDHVIDGGDAEGAWRTLRTLMLDFSRQRSGGDRAQLSLALRAAHFQLRYNPIYEADIRRLQQRSQESLDRLERFTHLPPVEGAPLRISRACTDELVRVAPQGSLLVTGDPGSGKSGTLREAAERLHIDGHPVLALAVEDYPVPTLKSLYNDLGLEHELPDVLRAWASDKPGILLIDALDASRGGTSELVFRNLIDLIVRTVPNWRVVATIRTFDLKHGRELADLFRGAPCSETFSSGEFLRVRHLNVPLLSLHELDQVRDPASSPLARLLAIAEPNLRDLIRSPFNLSLLAAILADGIAPESLNGISTAVQLLDRYWDIRVAGCSGSHLAREAFLRAALQRMLEKRQLSVGMAGFTENQAEHAAALLKDGVMVARSGRTATDIRNISFAHHRLFDYAVARLHLLSGEDVSILEAALADKGSLLLLTPALTLVFQMLWDGPEDGSGNRSTFWAIAVLIAGHDAGFEATLAPRVVAEAHVRGSDFEPLLARLAPGHGDRDSALRIVRHCFSILFAGIVPDDRAIGPAAGEWCGIALAVAEAAGLDAAWPIHVVAREWSNAPGLTPLQNECLNTVARHFLALLSSKESYPGRAGVVTSAILILSRTYDAAPTASAAALRTLLTPDHVAAYGHEELFWLAQAAKTLLAPAPELVGDIFRAAFQAPLPSAEEKTEFGRSSIMSLTSNRRQDFTTAINILEKQVASFIRSAPAVALTAVIAVLDAIIPREHSPQNGVEIFNHCRQSARFRRDSSHYWWRPEDDHGGHALLDGVVEGLVALIQEKGAAGLSSALAVIADNNTWACLWAALLRAVTRLTDGNGFDVVSLMRARPVLDALETRKPIGDVIRLLHGRLAPNDRLLVEQAVWECADQHGRDILIGCMQENDCVDPKVRLRRSELGSEAPKNLPPVRTTSSTKLVEEDWIYRQSGVDVSAEPNRSLIAAEHAVRLLSQSVGQTDQAEADEVQGWDKVHELLSMLAHSDGDEFVRTMAWDQAASFANRVLRTLPPDSGTALLPGLDDLIKGALAQRDWSLTTPAKKQEADFTRSPSWPSPAPRVEAIETLILGARVRGELPSEQAASLISLATDMSPAVRHQVFALIHIVYGLNPDVAWALCDVAFKREANIRGLSLFLHIFFGIADQRPEWSAERLLALRERMATVPGAEEALAEGYTACMLLLWLDCEEATAAVEVQGWAQDPIRWQRNVMAALLQLRGALVQGDGSDPAVEERRRRCIFFLQDVIDHAVGRLESAGTADQTDRDAVAAFRILDLVAREIYYGSGAYQASSGELSGPHTVVTTKEQQRRFTDEAGGILRTLGSVRHPAVTHHVLQTLAPFVDAAPERTIDLFMSILLDGGKKGGYQFETLAADLVIKTVQRCLADHRSTLLSSPDAQQRIVQVLSIFAEAGWPSARRLVYEVPEMLR